MIVPFDDLELVYQSLRNPANFFLDPVSMMIEKRCNHYRQIVACMLSGASRDRPVIEIESVPTMHYRAATPLRRSFSGGPRSLDDLGLHLFVGRPLIHQ
jgi:hypothetical protein